MIQAQVIVIKTVSEFNYYNLGLIPSQSQNFYHVLTELLISPQLTLPEGAQPRMCHTAIALSLGLGWTQVTMFGGCPKFEKKKTDDAQQKLAKTTVLDFGEQNAHTIFQYSFAWLVHIIHFY